MKDYNLAIFSLSQKLPLVLFFYLALGYIFLEIVRAVANYIREQRVTLSLLVDAFIILALREFIVNVVKINKEELHTFEAIFSSSVNYNLLILSGVILFLLVVRYLSVISSQRYLFKDDTKVD